MADSEEEAARWFAVLDRGVMTLAEREAYESWRSVPANAASLARFQALWERIGTARPDIAARSEAPVPAAPRMGLPRVAAVFIAASVTLPAFLLTNGTWWTTLDWWSR